MRTKQNITNFKFKSNEKNQFIGVSGIVILTFCSCNKENNTKKGNSTYADESALLQTTDRLKDFDFLVEKIRCNYPGYNDKITNETRSQLTVLEKEIRRKITNHPDSCSYYLNEYTAFFKDGHLGVYPIRTEIKGEIMDISTYGKICTSILTEFFLVSFANFGVNGSFFV
ncbi:MAG: hypothetical protein LBS52_06755 [Dysgonamonadaceae bacterium]|jgi:hypothetical protein|nr:hypothetical protein [Dysgonamonadaceae bacterium]